jgi:iron complex outermembrane receptor protein
VKPTDNFKITFAGDYSNKDDSSGNALRGLTPAWVQGTLTGYLGFFAGTAPNLPPGFVIGNTPKFTTAISTPGFVRLKDDGASATAVLNLPGVDLTSISAYRFQHTQFIIDLAASSAPLFAALVDNTKHYFYQEVRAVGTAEGPLHLIGGATFLNTYFHGVTTLNILDPLVVGVPTANGQDYVQNWSVYAQAQYDLTQALSLTASGRYVHESNSAVFPGNATEGLTQDKFLPSATLSYKLPGGGNVYVRWAEGFKAGGVNPVANPSAFTDPSTQGGIFKGETVNTYEAGIRAPLLDNKVQATAAVFYNDYKNLQTSAHANQAHALRGASTGASPRPSRLG